MGSLARRLIFAPVVLVVVTALTYAAPRVLRPELYAGQTVLGGTLHDMDRAFLHFDFGVACGWQGCPQIRDM